MSFAAKCMDKKSDEDSSRSDEIACYNFSVGNPQKKEFFSPNYPNDYPRNIMCSLRIKADVGHMVMLDFRDVFSIETSATCDYDYLEVRDGAYGYSPLLGKFCGHEFPIKLYSTKRYMWLQFKSDDTIEYKGFKAVYDYVPISNRGEGHDTEIECAFRKTGPSGIITKSEVIPLLDKYRHEDTVECMWTIVTESGKQLYMNFISYKLHRPNDCDQNFIQIFDGGRTPDKECIKFCGTTAEPQKTSTNMSYVRLFTHKDAFNDTDFTLHYTAFRPIEK
ncbi:Neuropilin and tolloid-like protein 2, partial [Stegodyphus mimosarum]